MAIEPGMFSGLNKYEAELMDAARQREASSADVGTGWQAMTQASGRAGGMIGRTVGKALGGVTTAEQRLQDFQAITATMPDFDFNNVEDLQEMSSKLWQGGFYDQGKELMDTANIYQRNLAEVANIEQQTASMLKGDTLDEMKFHLSKRMGEKQMEEIDALIFKSQYDMLNTDWEMELKEKYNDAQIDQIKQIISASKSGVTLAKREFDLSKKVSQMEMKHIKQQIANLESQVDVDEQTIKQSQEAVKASKAMTESLDKTDLQRNFEFAQENGNYTGSFEDYQKLVANLKTVATEGSINLYNFARTRAGGSYKGTLEEFITSVTGVDYKKAVKEGDKYKTTFYDYSEKNKTNLENFLNENIDMGGATGLIADIGNVEGASVLKDAHGDYTVEQIGKHLFQMGKNAGIDPQQVWKLYKGDIDFIMNQPIMKGTLDDYKKWEPPVGGGADAGDTVDSAAQINVSF